MSYTNRQMSAEFIGQSPETLQAWLTAAQTALQDLSTGGKPVTLSYNTGAGSKSVTYQMTDIGMLERRISALAHALGLAPRRRAMSPGF